MYSFKTFVWNFYNLMPFISNFYNFSCTLDALFEENLTFTRRPKITYTIHTQRYDKVASSIMVLIWNTYGVIKCIHGSNRATYICKCERAKSAAWGWLLRD